MELELRPAGRNSFPLAAILIPGEHPAGWLLELQRMEISLAGLNVYALPGIGAGQAWGCVAVGEIDPDALILHRNSLCQVIHQRLIIPERSIIHPLLAKEELIQLCAGNLYFMHPELGFLRLNQPVQWSSLLVLPQSQLVAIVVPADTPVRPARVKSFQLKSKPPDELIEDLEKNHFPESRKFSEKPLTIFERIKLAIYRPLFSSLPTKSKAGSKQFAWLQKLQQDHKILEERNEKHLDKLLRLFEKNIQEALRYAVPLDTDGSGRGPSEGSFLMQKRWLDFSLGSRSTGTGGVSVTSDDSFGRLWKQYTDAAAQLIREGDFSKAAFVYLKLLKDYPLAAQTLEQGKLFREAAAIYLKHVKDFKKAAACFAQGGMVERAIEIYKDLKEHEKVGDLYRSLKKEEDALYHYRSVVKEQVKHHQYLKAARVYEEKMQDTTAAQQVLLRGWRSGREAVDCLMWYFSTQPDSRSLEESIQTVYSLEVSPANREQYLLVLQKLFANHPDIGSAIKNVAYEIIAEEAKKNPAIVSELRVFNKHDKQIVKDLLRFKITRKQ